jgi:Hypoxia induced protein conserved region
VPGALLTAGVLTAGLISFRQGNSNLGQKLMRARVVVQGATVALMVGSAYYYGEHFTGAKKQEKWEFFENSLLLQFPCLLEIILVCYLNGQSDLICFIQLRFLEE